MYIKDFSNIRRKLVTNGVRTEDIEFIRSKIEDSNLDEDFKIIHQEVYREMINRGIWDAFEKSCKELDILITHQIEPEQ